MYQKYYFYTLKKKKNYINIVHLHRLSEIRFDLGDHSVFHSIFSISRHVLGSSAAKISANPFLNRVKTVWKTLYWLRGVRQKQRSACIPNGRRRVHDNTDLRAKQRVDAKRVLSCTDNGRFNSTIPSVRAEKKSFPVRGPPQNRAICGQFSGGAGFHQHSHFYQYLPARKT